MVVFHDPSFERVCGSVSTGAVSVRSCKYSELPPLVSGRGEKFQIPLFEDILKDLPTETLMIVEFKEGDTELIEKVYETRSCFASTHTSHP